MLITAVDLGTHAVKVAVAELRKDGTLALRKISRGPSAGMRRGAIYDIGEAIRAFSRVASEVKRDFPQAFRRVYLAYGGADVMAHPSRGIVAVSRADSEIHRDDIERAIEASQALKLPRNRSIIYSLTQEYIVDEAQHISDPTGMIGSRLEVRSLIIEGFAPALKDAERCVEVCGGTVAATAFAPLAASRAVVSKSQRELGVCLIDIGAGKTGLAVYDQGTLIHTSVIPLGAGHLTNDLAIGLRTTPAVAEHIKLTLGLVPSREAPARETVELRKFDASLKTSATRRFIAEVIEDRLAEIFSIIQNELGATDRAGKLPSGAIFVGGGAKLPGLAGFARQELKVAAQVGVPLLSEFDLRDPELSSAAEDPEMATALGLLLLAADGMERGGGGHETPRWIAKIFKHFMP